MDNKPIESKKQEPLDKKQVAGGCLIMVIGAALIVFLIIMLLGDRPENKETLEEQTLKYSEGDKELFVNLIDTISAIEKNCQSVYTKYNKVMKDAQHGKTTLVNMYNVAKEAKEKTYSAWYQLSQLKTPKEIDGELKEIYDDLLENIQMAYFTKSESFKYAMKFIDENRVSYQDKMEENADASQVYLLKASQKMIEGQLLLGIEIDDNNSTTTESKQEPT